MDQVCTLGAFIPCHFIHSHGHLLFLEKIEMCAFYHATGSD